MATLYLSEDSLKSLRETFCVAQSSLGERERTKVHRERLGRIINEIDRQRPLGRDGKHGNLHTETCGCEDK